MTPILSNAKTPQFRRGLVAVLLALTLASVPLAGCTNAQGEVDSGRTGLAVLAGGAAAVAGFFAIKSLNKTSTSTSYQDSTGYSAKTTSSYK